MRSESREGPLLPQTSLHPHVLGGAGQLSGVLFIRALIPRLRALPRDLSSSQRAPSIAMELGFRTSEYKFRRNTNIQRTAGSIP